MVPDTPCDNFGPEMTIMVLNWTEDVLDFVGIDSPGVSRSEIMNLRSNVKMHKCEESNEDSVNDSV
jgi:hypothetical protein